jgi:hypothetical protein
MSVNQANTLKQSLKAVYHQLLHQSELLDG